MRKILLLMITLLHSPLYASYIPMQPGINGHVTGDIIALRSDNEIAAWCNFDKSVVVTSTNVLCVYNGSRKSPSGS